GSLHYIFICDAFPRRPSSPLSLHDALPISLADPLRGYPGVAARQHPKKTTPPPKGAAPPLDTPKSRAWLIHQRLGLPRWAAIVLDRKSTRLNSSHVSISYAVFCLKKKKNYK